MAVWLDISINSNLMIKTVAFDYTGVIAPGPVSEWLKQNFTAGDKRYELFSQYSKKWDLGKVNLQQFYRMISDATGVAPKLVWKTYFENSIVNKDVVKIIRKLRKNYKIILFSNNIGELLRKVLVKQDITNLFDEILISSEYKMTKPSVDFFKLMLLKAKNNKKEVVFIDDRQINVDASNCLGIKAFLYIDATTLIKDLQSIGVKI